MWRKDGVIDMTKCVDIKSAWDFNILCDWFINSIDETEPLCWTPEHIEELLDSFYVIPKRKEIATPVFDAEPVVRCKDCGEYQTKNRPFPRCRITGRMKGADDYCSDGYTEDGE